MKEDSRILEILKTTLNRWVDETPKDKVMSEREAYKDVLEYIESLEYDYKRKVNNIPSTIQSNK